jgi:hypothetical protein
VWQEDLRAALSDRQGSAIFISTPDGRGYFYDLFMRGQSDDWPDWASWQLPSSTNPTLNKGEIDAARRELPDWVFRQEYGAEFVAFEGKVYKAFSPECPLVLRGDPDLTQYKRYWGGIDFGFANPTAMVLAGEDEENRLDLVTGFYQAGLTSPEIVERCVKIHQDYRMERLWCDSASPDPIAQLRSAGVPAIGVSKATNSTERSSIMAGIIKVETRMVNGRLRFWMDHLPPEVIEETDGYSYPPTRDDREVKEVPLKVRDHAPDALRYLVMGYDDLHGRVPNVRVAA